MTLQAAMIKGTETFELRSKYTGWNYLISVGFPHGYTREPNRKWPVVYLLDSNLFFGMVTEIVRSMSWCGATRDAIVVGIGYATDSSLEDTWHEVFTWRYKDLTPVPDEERVADRQKMLDSRGYSLHLDSGGGEDFINFLYHELMPAIESEYRVDPQDRTLVGHSLGGLFSLFAMFRKPEVFQHYLALSPSLSYMDAYMLEVEERFATRNRKTLPADLFLSMGELEDDLPLMYRLASRLEARDYRRFGLTKRLIPGEDHCTCLAPSLQAGLKNALKV